VYIRSVLAAAEIASNNDSMSRDLGSIETIDCDVYQVTPSTLPPKSRINYENVF